MVPPWGVWRSFPDPQSDRPIEAPVGPGIYEVRHAETGALVAFGHAGNVARVLSDMTPKPSARLFRAFRRSLSHRVEELEYRTCATASAHAAKSAAEHLRDRRDAYWRRRALAG